MNAYYNYLTWYSHFECATTDHFIQLAEYYNFIYIVFLFSFQKTRKRIEKQKQVMFLLREIHFCQCRAKCTSIGTYSLKRADIFFRIRIKALSVSRIPFLYILFIIIHGKFLLARALLARARAPWLFICDWTIAAVFAAVFERMPNRKFANILIPFVRVNCAILCLNRFFFFTSGCELDYKHFISAIQMTEKLFYFFFRNWEISRCESADWFEKFARLLHEIIKKWAPSWSHNCVSF